MKCFECNGEYEKKPYRYEMYGIFLCNVNSLVCNKCEDLVFNDKASKKIEIASKKKGLWGLAWNTKIGQVGNSLDVKIHKALANYLKLKKGDEVKVYPESKNKLIVEIC